MVREILTQGTTVKRPSEFCKQKYRALVGLVKQEDSAACHMARVSRQFLTELHRDFEWASYSADLNPLDYWLWHTLKTWCYKKSTKSMGNLSGK